MVRASALSLLLFGTHSRKAPPRRCQVMVRQKEAIVRPQAADVPVYDYRLRGREFFHQFWHKRKGFAPQMFSLAIEIDRGYARAYARPAPTGSAASARRNPCAAAG